VPTRAKSREPVYSQALNHNKISKPYYVMFSGRWLFSTSLHNQRPLHDLLLTWHSSHGCQARIHIWNTYKLRLDNYVWLFELFYAMLIPTIPVIGINSFF